MIFTHTAQVAPEEPPEPRGGGREESSKVKVPPKVPEKPKNTPPLLPKPLSRNNSPSTAKMEGDKDTPKPLPRSVSPSVLPDKAPPPVARKPNRVDAPEAPRPQPVPRTSFRHKKPDESDQTRPVPAERETAAAVAPPTGSSIEAMYSVVNSTPKDSSTPKKNDSKANKSVSSAGSRSILETVSCLGMRTVRTVC